MRVWHLRQSFVVLGLWLASGLIGQSSWADAAPLLQTNDKVELINQELRLPVSLLCPRFVFSTGQAGGAQAPTRVDGSLEAGKELLAEYEPLSIGDSMTLEVKVHVAWSDEENVLRKWAEYRVQSAPDGCVLKEIQFDQLAPVAGQAIDFVPSPPQSFPGFFRGFFAGVEFPIASTRMEGDGLLLAQHPGRLFKGDSDWLASRKVLYGPAPVGREREVFADLVAQHRPQPHGLHFNYNSWYTLPWPCSEKMTLDLMQVFNDNLNKPYGVSFDSFTIDMGWSDPKSLWQIDQSMFPQGFVNIKKQAESMNAKLGLWISPTSCYPPALDNEWAKANGYETYLTGQDGKFRACCLGGPKYAEEFKNRLVSLAVESGVRQFKLDGYWFLCPESDHGHQPGEDSAEATAEGAIRAFEAVRAAAPDIWLEPTCFGSNPSPWWLYYVNSVIGTFGDDNPPPRSPCPIDRESMTTSRDFFNLQGAALLTLPIVAQEVLGINHQTEHPFLNDAVDVILRGHAFIPLYVNPRNMNPRRWAMLADVMKWARANEATLAQTRPLLPEAWQTGNVPHFDSQAVMPRQPYGYLHWANGQGLIHLRNPWIKQQSVRIDLGRQLGIPDEQNPLDAVSIYPDVRLYGQNLTASSILEVSLAPYETVVISLQKGLAKHKGLKPSCDVIGRELQVRGMQAKLERLQFKPSDVPPVGPSWTAPLGGKEAIQLTAKGDVTASDVQSEILVILEGKANSPSVSRAAMKINGVETPLQVSHSESIWVASYAPPPEPWTLLRAPLKPGKNTIDLSVLCDSETTTVSCWAWAWNNTAQEPVRFPNALPKPEQLFLDSKALLDSQNVCTAALVADQECPVERIDGVYLDSLEPATQTQDVKTLQKNTNVMGKTIMIFDQQCIRGIGTHANARLVYDIGGKGFKRFQSWVGGDAGNQAATVSFTVIVDGQKRWESGYLSSQQPGRQIDLDITGASTLELLVGDGGNGNDADWADFGDAKLLYH